MPTLKLRNEEVEFTYLDSGKPKSTIYTTIVLIHGHTFHSGVFRRLLPLATSKDVRIIAVNRRDYAGSTVFNPAELKQLNSGDEIGHASFLQNQGVEMGLFVASLIETLDLPEPSEDGTNGGVALIGWSLGNILPILVMSSITLLPAELRMRLQLYVRRTILYDAPYLAFGFQAPAKQYLPLFDTAIPEAKRGQVFADWVSNYFPHKDLASRNIDNLVFKTPDFGRKSTLSRMTEQELPAIVDMAAAQRGDNAFITTMQPSLFQQTCTAMFDSISTNWPNLKVWVLHGDCSPWLMPFAAWEIERLEKVYNKVKTVEILVLKDANHFLFWEEPQKALDAFVYCLEN